MSPEFLGAIPLEMLNAALNGVALFLLRSAVKEVRELHLSVVALQAKRKEEAS